MWTPDYLRSSLSAVWLDGEAGGERELMAADLTVDNVCEAIRHFLRHIAAHPEEPVDQEKGLILFGTPGNDEMRGLMEAFGGTLRITVREAPAGIADDALADDLLVKQGANVWRPEDQL